MGNLLPGGLLSLVGRVSPILMQEQRREQCCRRGETPCHALCQVSPSHPFVLFPLLVHDEQMDREQLPSYFLLFPDYHCR